MKKQGKSVKKVGMVKNRSQFENKKTGLWSKLCDETGKILSTKNDGTPYKNIKKIR